MKKLLLSLAFLALLATLAALHQAAGNPGCGVAAYNISSVDIRVGDPGDYTHPFAARLVTPAMSKSATYRITDTSECLGNWSLSAWYHLFVTSYNSSFRLVFYSGSVTATASMKGKVDVSASATAPRRPGKWGFQRSDFSSAVLTWDSATGDYTETVSVNVPRVEADYTVLCTSFPCTWSGALYAGAYAVKRDNSGSGGGGGGGGQNPPPGPQGTLRFGSNAPASGHVGYNGTGVAVPSSHTLDVGSYSLWAENFTYDMPAPGRPRPAGWVYL